MGIYDIFSKVAQQVERVPWRWKLAAGATAGVAGEFAFGDPNQDFMDRITKGLMVGSALGLGAGYAVRATVRGAQAIEWGGRKAITSKMSAYKTQGYKAFMKPGTLALGGALAGAALAPSGSRLMGAAIGGGLGFAAMPAIKGYKAFDALGYVPGAQTGALIAAATVPVAAGAIFGRGASEAEANAIPGLGAQMDYQPLDGGMRNRAIAMNASGDIVLGLNNRKHG